MGRLAIDYDTVEYAVDLPVQFPKGLLPEIA
jgi:hypothetical protein